MAPCETLLNALRVNLLQSDVGITKTCVCNTSRVKRTVWLEGIPQHVQWLSESLLVCMESKDQLSISKAAHASELSTNGRCKDLYR